MQNLI